MYAVHTVDMETTSASRDAKPNKKLWVGPVTDSTPGKKTGSGPMSSSEHNVPTAPAPSVSGKNGLAPTSPTPVPALPPAPVSCSSRVALG